MIEVRVEKLDKEESDETICVNTPEEPKEDKEKTDLPDGEVTMIEVRVGKLDKEESDETICVTTADELQFDEDASQSLDKTSIREENQHIEPDVCIIQPEITCVVTTEGPMINPEKIVLPGEVTDDKEKLDHPDGEVTMMEVRVESLDKEADETTGPNVDQYAPPSLDAVPDNVEEKMHSVMKDHEIAYATLTTELFETVPEDQEKTDQTDEWEVSVEKLYMAGPWKANETIFVVAEKGPNIDALKSLDEPSLIEERMDVDHEVCVLQPDTQATTDGLKITCVDLTLEPRSDTEHTEKQELQSSVEPRKADEAVCETICVITLKDPEFYQDAPQSLDQLSVSEEKVHTKPEVCVVQPDTQIIVTEHEITYVPATKEPIFSKQDLKAFDVQEDKDEVFPDDFHDAFQSLDETTVYVTKVHMESEQASILSEKIPEHEEKPKQTAGEVTMVEIKVGKHDMDGPEIVNETTSAMTAKGLKMEKVQTSITRETVPESKLKPTTNIHLKETVIGTKVDIHEIQEDAVQSDTTEPYSFHLSAAQQREAETFSKINLAEPDSTNLHDHEVQGEQAGVSADDICDAPASLDETFVSVEIILKAIIKKHEITYVTVTREPRIDAKETCALTEKVPDDKAKPGCSAVKMTVLEVKVETHERDESQKSSDTTTEGPKTKIIPKTTESESKAKTSASFLSDESTMKLRVDVQSSAQAVQSDSTEPSGVDFSAVQTTVTEMNLSERNITKPRETVIKISLTDREVQEKQSEISAQDVYDASPSLDEAPDSSEAKEHESTRDTVTSEPRIDTERTDRNVMSEKVPEETAGEMTMVDVTVEEKPETVKKIHTEDENIDVIQTSMMCESIPVSKVKMTADVHSLEPVVETRVDSQQSDSEQQQDSSQCDITQSASAHLEAVQPVDAKVELVNLSLSEQVRAEASQSDTQQEQHVPMSKQEMLDEVKSQDIKSVIVHEQKTVTAENEPKIKLDTVAERVEEKDKVSNSDMNATDATENKEDEEQEKNQIQEQQGETRVEVKKQDILLPETTTSEGKLQSLGLPKVLSAEVKLSPAQNPVTEVDEVTQVGGLLAHENEEEEENVSKTKNLVLETGECSTMRSDFTEIQPLVGTGRSSQLIQEDEPETLITPTSDMEACLHRLVVQILSCKNRPAELSPAAMARQVEEAQQCRDAAQAQVSLLCHLRGTDAANRDVLEDQWSTAAQDAAAVIQSKETELQLVNDYCRQIQAVRTTVERQTTELDHVKTSPQESSSKEVEKLSSLQRNMEANIAVFGDLLLIFTKLCPQLRRSERATAHTEHKNLQEKWRGLERAVERNLHHANVTSHEIGSIQSQISTLQEHLEAIEKDLEAMSPSATQWNCKKAQQLMKANAEVKAAQQRYHYLVQVLETLLLSSWWEEETKVQQHLQMIEDKMNHTEKLVSRQSQTISNPVMEKIITVMSDGLVWAKQTESDIEGRRRRVPLLPEEVHHQLRDLKKLQSEVMGKQGQLELLVEEVTELLPQLDQSEEVPMVRTSLQTLHKLSNSTTDKLAAAVRDIESGLQTREKMSEQIADLDSWVVAHLHREASRAEDGELRSQAELERRARQIQETLNEADKLAAVCETLLMKSRDISSELSVLENCWLFEKISNLQEGIRAITIYEKTNNKELDEILQTVDLNKKNLVTIEQSLRQMMLDLSRQRFPITTESLQPLKPFKNQILEHKSQIDLLQPWIPQEKAVELHTVISEIHNKMINLETKARDHEKYLSMRKHVEELRDDVQDQVRQTKDDSKGLEEKYKICQTLFVQFPLVKWFCEEALSELQAISLDLYPSQQTTEKQRLKQTEENLDTWQIMLHNNLSIIQWDLLKELDLVSVKKDTQAFLMLVQQQLQKHTEVEPNEAVVSEEYRRILSLKKTVESKMRAVEILEQKKGNRKDGFKDLTVLKNSVLGDCDSKMESVLQARESLKSYTCAVKRAALFLRDVEVSLLPPHGSVGLCSERLEETQRALTALQQQFQTYVEQLQSQFSLHPLLSPQKAEQLQENILSQLLVRMSALQAKGHHQLESLSRCAEHHRTYSKCGDELIQGVKSAEDSLLQLISQKPTCLSDCTDQESKLTALCDEEASLLRRLDDMKEWCPEPCCRSSREAAVTAIWRRVTRLWRCSRELAARSRQRILEWSDVTKSVEKASTVLDQVEAELPNASQVNASTEELHDLLQSWEQYQDRLDCEHRSLSALELRAARMLGVPAHLEEAPPTPLCQKLQAMQARYGSVKQRSREGLEATRSELELREKVQKGLQGVRVWLEAADALLSEMERNNSTQELQEVHCQLYTQKTLLQRIMESLKMKYPDVDTLIPVEIEGQVQEITQSLQRVEVKLGEAVERSGPVHRLGAKLSELQAGLRSVQERLDKRSPTVIEAKVTQKRVWDELDVWHSCLAAVEVDMQDLDKPEEALSLTEKLVEVQQLHSQLSKRAEQRTTLLSKIHTWLQEHREMISSSKSWMAEAQSWLAAPCTYTTSKCLSSHVQSLQMVLSDSAQIRTTLQGFSSVLRDMSQVCDITTLQQQLLDADHQVAEVQDSFTAPLAHLQHAAAEVEAVESKVRRMENDVAEIKTSLSSPESFPSPREEHLKVVEHRIQSMRKTVAEIQDCKPGLCLPEKAEETLTVFSVVDQLQTVLLELEKKVPALFIQQPPTPVQTKAQSAEQKKSLTETEVGEKEEAEDGHIKIVHVEEDILKKSGASLLTVERSTPGQRESWTPDTAQEVTEVSGPDQSEAAEAAAAADGQSSGHSPEDTQDVVADTDITGASSPEALSKPVSTVTAQSLPENMVNMPSTIKATKPDSDPQQKCVVS